MTTSKQNIKSHLLRSLLVVAMLVCGVGSSWADDYVFMYPVNNNNIITGNFLCNNNNQIGNTTYFDVSTCVFIGPAYGATSGTFQSKSNTSYYLYEEESSSSNWGQTTYDRSLILSTQSTSYSISSNRVYLSARYQSGWYSQNEEWYIYFNDTWQSIINQESSGRCDVLYRLALIPAGLSAPEISGLSRLSQTGEYSYSAEALSLPEYYKFTGASTYYYYNGEMSTSLPGGTSRGVTYSYSLSANTYASVDPSTGVITVNSLPESDTELTLTVTASKSGTASVSSTKTIILSQKAYNSDNNSYVIFSGSNYLNNSTSGTTTFSPSTCLWAFDSNNYFTNGTSYIRNGGNNVIGTEGRTCTLGDQNGTTQGKTLYCNSNYLRYNNGWTRTTKTTDSGINVVYSVDKRTYDEVYIKPSLNGVNEVTRTGRTEFTYDGGKYIQAYVDYVFYNNTSHCFDTSGNSISQPSEEQFTSITNRWLEGAGSNVSIDYNITDRLVLNYNTLFAEDTYVTVYYQVKTTSGKEVTISKTILFKSIPAYTITLNVNPENGGTASANPESAYEGEEVTLTASPADEYKLVSWTSDEVTVSNNKFTMPAKNVTINANFAVIQYPISTVIDPTTGGTVTAKVGDDVVTAAPKGATVTLTANPASGYEFNSWTVTQTDGTVVNKTSGEGNVYTFTMPKGNVSVKAIFTRKGYTITTKAEPATGGTITGGGVVMEGGSTTLTARANEGYTFSKWHDDVTTNPREITNIQADATYTAIFTATKYKVQKVVAANGGDFTISGTEQEGGNDVAGTGTVLTLTAEPASGYDLGSWKIMDASDNDITSTVGMNQNGNTATFYMPAKDIKVTATFTLHKYKINLTQPAEGTISSDPATSAEMGTEVTLSYTENAGYEFQSWTVVSGDITITDNKFTMPASDVTISATYIAKTYNITINATGGSVTANPTSGHAGDKITLTATPDTGNSLYSIKGKRDDDQQEFQISKSGTNYSFTMPTSNVTITAEFVAFQTGSCEDDPTMTWIASLSDITEANGRYRLAIDNPSGEPNYTGSEFSGVLDGYFHIVSGRTSALFNELNGATVKNVILDKVSISRDGDVGAIANVAANSKIYNCGVLSSDGTSTVTCTASGKSAGGIVGYSYNNSRVVNCYNYATVSAVTYAAGIVGYNGGGARTTNCMMYGDMTNGTNRAPVAGGDHTSNVQNYTEYNYYRSKANLSYTTYNEQLAIDKDEYLTRFPFYRHIQNTHRELASYFLFGDYEQAHVSEIGHWVVMPEMAPYPIIEPWATNTKKTTEDIKNNLPITTDDYAGKLLTEMGSSGYLKVNWSVYGQSGSVDLPITDMDTSNYDFTWGKVVLPFANELAERNTYAQVCTGWKITGVTGGSTEGSLTNYNFADRDCTAKDLYANNGGYVFAQGGNYIVPYGVTEITVEANMATAYYLSDASYDIAYDANYDNETALGGSVPTTYHGQTVYTDLNTLMGKMGTSTNPHTQAIVLVGNYHYNQNTIGGHIFGDHTTKGLTIMSVDEDNNQEPDYGWYSFHTTDRTDIPPMRFDFVPNIGIGMAARVSDSNAYPTIGIWHSHGWFELTETCVSIMNECEINSYSFNSNDNGSGNNRWIANSGYFLQIVRTRDGNCTKLSYIQIGGNAYVEELYPGSHTDNARQVTLCPINVNGGEIENCFMTGYNASATATGSDIYFWSAGGKMHKWLGAYLENPSTNGVNVTAKVDHAIIGRFFGGGTSTSAQITGNIDITMNNSKVEFYCGGPEFGDMSSGKTVTTNAKGTTFGEYYGAGFGGTSITNVRHGNSGGVTFNGDVTFPLGFDNYKRLALNGDGIGVNYKFEYILYSGGNAKGVARFFTGYAAFSKATTGAVTNNLENCTIEKNFFGGGCQGNVSGTITSSLTGCTIKGSAFGGGYKAPETTVDVYPATQPTYSVYNKETGIFSDFGTTTPVPFTWVHAAAAGSNDGNREVYTKEDLTDLGSVSGAITLTIDGGTVGGNVYGGGNESQAKNNATVTIKGNAAVANNVFGGGNLANVSGATKVNINGGTLNTTANTAVYGGGALANVGGDTEVNLTGGTVGSVYGGGLGQLADAEAGKEAIAATVGSATINIGSGTPDNSETGGATNVAGSCQITGSVFGCNNLNGTPTGNATVNVFKTYNATPDNPNSYNSKIEAVYGGGNLAAYVPTADTSTAKVTVYTCYNAIDYVYGGGNAASTPATSVTIWGGKMINVFGGGNGAGEGNPGADVGYKDFTWDDSHAYGAGTTTVNIWGGVIENVFGGSNTRGNIRVSSNVNLDDKEGCEFQIGGVYGAGNEAAMYGNGNLVIGCIPGMTEIYGGSKAADINGDVSLTITNGTFGKVFGGNNLGGKLNGSITVNIEETGCKPVIIGELYGCGNQAPYSVYGYEEDLDANGKVVVKESGDKLHNDPVVNIYSCTSIGSVFGGGYGAGAVVVGSPTVNINQVKGTPNNVESSSLGTIGTIFGGGNAAKVIGDTHVNIGTLKKYTVIYGNAKGQEKTIVGANITGNVFGGGNEAEVTGKTNVVIGADK